MPDIAFMRIFEHTSENQNFTSIKGTRTNVSGTICECRFAIAGAAKLRSNRIYINNNVKRRDKG